MEKVTKGLTNWLSSEGMTQKDVAEKLGVSEQFVNALFNGRREFGKKTANDWQKLFWLSASWLRTGEGKMLADDEAVDNTGGGDRHTEGDYLRGVRAQRRHRNRHIHQVQQAENR